jgi:DNA-binding NarL/FixJ family response regulator
VITCHVVEDEPLLRQLLVQVLESHPQARVLGSSGSVAEAVAHCRQDPPDLLVIDLKLPDGSGLDAALAVVAAHPDVRVVVLSAEASTFVCPQPLRVALSGVIDKIHAFQQLPLEIDDLLNARS